MKKTLYSVLLSFMCSFAYVDESSISKSKILTLYHEILNIKTKDQVEKVLGKPIFTSSPDKDGSHEDYYLDWRFQERELQDHESLWSFAAIIIHYDKNGKVVSRQYNHQWIKEDVRKKYEAKQELEEARSNAKKALKKAIAEIELLTNEDGHAVDKEFGKDKILTDIKPVKMQNQPQQTNR